MPSKVIRTIKAGNSPVLEILSDDPAIVIELRDPNNHSESIKILVSMIPTLTKALSEVHAELDRS